MSSSPGLKHSPPSDSSPPPTAATAHYLRRSAMAGPEKRGPRRGRGRSKRPRVPEPGGESSAPRDSATTAGYAPINLTKQPSSAYSINQPQSSDSESLARTQLPGFDNKPPPGKVAIPRPSVVAESSKPSKKGRTSHACDACRKAKAACTGGQPCMRCRNAQVTCVYGDGKRDKDRK